MRLTKHLPLLLAIGLICTVMSLSAGTNDTAEEQSYIMQAPRAGTGYFGVMITELSEDELADTDYPYSFGAMIQSVVDDSPAEQAGLQDGDIIMSVDEVQVTDKDTFMQIASTLEAGQTVNLEIYRDGDVLTLPVVLGTKEAQNVEVNIEKVKRPRSRVGIGGGTWMPIWFKTDMTDINNMISSFGFSAFGNDGLLLQGGLGRGNVGNGFFLGGQGASYSIQKKKIDPDDPTYSYWMNYSNSMSGITLDKRFPIAGKLLGSIGVMLGAGDHTLQLSHNNGNYDWNDIDSTLVNSGNTFVMLTRGYAVVQPRAELLYHILPWFGIRAEAGYTYGFSVSDGWKVRTGNNETYDVTNSPNTPFKGINVSVGPWFGF